MQLIDRRQLISGLIGSAVGSIAWREAVARGGPGPLYLASRADPKLHYHLTALDAEGRGQFDLDLPDRGHGLALHPAKPLGVVFARRPGRFALVFGTLDQASAFFKAGSLGYSATSDPEVFQGMELHCRNWEVAPLEIESASSSYFDDPALFPPGSINLDCALLMRGIAHEWRSQADLCCETLQPALAMT